jgi:hypothetical protein
MVITEEFISKTTSPLPCTLPPGERGSIIPIPRREGIEGRVLNMSSLMNFLVYV